MTRQNTQLYKSLFGIGAVLVCFLLLSPMFRVAPAGAQSQPSLEDTNRDREIERRIQTFFTSLRDRNPSVAFEGILRQSPLNVSTQTSELQSRVEELGIQFGNILDWERYETKLLGVDVIVMRYILKYDQYPVIWTFTFYRKPTTTISTTTSISNNWVLIGLQFDTNLFEVL